MPSRDLSYECQNLMTSVIWKAKCMGDVEMSSCMAPFLWGIVGMGIQGKVGMGKACVDS